MHTLDAPLLLLHKGALEVPACGALFARLKLDGPTALASTSYSSPRTGRERALCGRGVLAVARVGGSEIRLCPRLWSLAHEGVAAILIHETLHTAGLGEWPQRGLFPGSRHEVQPLLGSYTAPEGLGRPIGGWLPGRSRLLRRPFHPRPYAVRSPP